MANDNYEALLEKVVATRVEELKTTPDRAFMSVAHELALQDFDLSLDEIDAGLTDGGGDGQIDAVYVLVNGVVLTDDSEDEIPEKGPIELDIFLVQSKNSSRFEENPLKIIRTTVSDLFNLKDSYDTNLKNYSELLQAKFAVARDALVKTAGRTSRVSVRVIYATKASTAGIHPSVSATAEALKDDIKKQLATEDIDIKFLGAEELISISREPKTKTRAIGITESISSDTGDSFVCLVTLDSLVRFLSDDHGFLVRPLFDANVRDFLGKTEVNDAIKETLKTLPSGDFWWFNNGVTIVASRIDQKGKTLALEDPLVVNGLQTSNVLHAFMNDQSIPQETRESRRKNIVLVRIIVPGDEKTRDEVIKATNSQTHIPKPYLRGMDKVHRNIEDHLKGAGLFYERRKNQYRNLGKSRADIVTLIEMAQSLMAAILFRPADARGRPNSLLKSDEDYQGLFSEDYALDTYTRVIQAKRMIVDRIVAIYPEATASFRNDIVFHILAYLSATKFFTSDHARAEWRNAAFSEAQIDDAVKVVANLFEGQGGTDRIAKSPDFQALVLEAAKAARQTAAT